MPLHNKRTFLLVLVFFYAVLVLLHWQVDYGEFGRDDFDYLVEASGRNFPNWTSHWYNHWSGRISVHSVIYLAHKVGIEGWRLVNPLFVLLLAYSAARTAFGPAAAKQPTPFFLAAFTLITLISGRVMVYAAFWHTGSFNYLWTVALGLLAVLPYTDSAFHTSPSRPAWYHILAGLFVVTGQEQVAVIVLMLMISAALVLLARKLLTWPLIINLGLLWIGFLILLTAPGNAIRLNDAAAVYFPGFPEFALTAKIRIGLEFVFQSIFESNLLLLFLFLGLLVLGLLRLGRINALTGTIATVLFIACLLLVIAGKESDAHINGVFVNFEHLIEYDRAAMIAYSRFDGDFLHSALSIIFWGTILFVLAPLGIVFLSSTEKTTVVFNLLIYACAMLSLAMLTFSPSMYGSGERVRFVYAVFLGILILRLSEQIMPGGLIRWRPAQVVCCAASITFLLPYFMLLSQYSLAPKVSVAGETGNMGRQSCGVDGIEIEHFYVLRLEGWINGADTVIPNTRYLILLKPENGGAPTAYQVAASFEPSSPAFTETAKSNQVKVKGRANFVHFPAGRYSIGLGTLHAGEDIPSVCYLRQTIIIESKFKVLLEE